MVKKKLNKILPISFLLLASILGMNRYESLDLFQLFHKENNAHYNKINNNNNNNNNTPYNQEIINDIEQFYLNQDNLSNGLGKDLENNLINNQIENSRLNPNLNQGIDALIHDNKNNKNIEEGHNTPLTKLKEEIIEFSQLNKDYIEAINQNNTNTKKLYNQIKEYFVKINQDIVALNDKNNQSDKQNLTNIPNQSIISDLEKITFESSVLMAHSDFFNIYINFKSLPKNKINYTIQNVTTIFRKVNDKYNSFMNQYLNNDKNNDKNNDNDKNYDINYPYKKYKVLQNNIENAYIDAKFNKSAIMMHLIYQENIRHLKTFQEKSNVFQSIIKEYNSFATFYKSLSDENKNRNTKNKYEINNLLSHIIKAVYEDSMDEYFIAFSISRNFDERKSLLEQTKHVFESYKKIGSKINTIINNAYSLQIDDYQRKLRLMSENLNK